MGKAEALKLKAEDEAKYFAMLDNEMKRSSANREFFGAGKKARISMDVENLLPFWEDYEWRYTPEQVAKAAVHTREEVMALTHIQYAVLKRLDRNRNYMLGIIGLLLYIASKLS